MCRVHPRCCGQIMACQRTANASDANAFTPVICREGQDIAMLCEKQQLGWFCHLIARADDAREKTECFEMQPATPVSALLCQKSAANSTQEYALLSFNHLGFSRNGLCYASLCYTQARGCMALLPGH